MLDNRDPLMLQFGCSVAQLAMLEAFQRKERLSSRSEALALLMEIALDVVTAQGRRFWDQTTDQGAGQAIADAG